MTPRNYFGHCPNCSKPLEKKEGFALCPAGDYKAPADSFESRWNRYDEERKKLASDLLQDLRALNLIKKESTL